MNSKIESVGLTIWNDQGECLEVDLEPWQVNAIVQILGLNISYAGNGAYDIRMLPQKYVQEMVDGLKYQLVNKNQIKK